MVLACRSVERAEAAGVQIEDEAPGAAVEVAQLDLGELASVRGFAGRFRDEHEGPDLLINNAGVMAPPRRQTADGFELQFGTNHLGHFALTGLLVGAMRGRGDPRVVTLTSSMHRLGRISFDNLNGKRRYNNWLAYSQSKLANLLFALELDRRLRAAGSAIRSMAAHPGYAATNLQHAGPRRLESAVLAISNRILAQSSEMGALPTLYAATYPGLDGGTFVGPDGFAEQHGHPKPVSPSRAALDDGTAERLWAVSEELTGVPFEI